MTLATSFRSLIQARHEGGDHSSAARFLRECRDALAPAELSVPAALLADAGAAQWCREHQLSVDVASVGKLNSAVAADIDPWLLTVDAHGFTAAELAQMADLGVGRVVVDDVAQVAELGACADQPLDVVVQQEDSDALDAVVVAVLTRRTLRLIGVRGGGDPAVAVGLLIEQLDHIRRHHDCLLTRVYLGGVAIGYPQTTAAGVRAVGVAVDEAATDACATLRFPRPVVVIGPS